MKRGSTINMIKHGLRYANVNCSIVFGYDRVVITLIVKHGVMLSP